MPILPDWEVNECMGPRRKAAPVSEHHDDVGARFVVLWHNVGQLTREETRISRGAGQPRNPLTLQTDIPV